MDAIKDELYQLLKHGNLGNYNYCEVVQVVLFSDSKAINFYTNIDFSSKHKTIIPFAYLTDRPVLITDNYKLAISRYTICVDQFMELYCDASENGIWKYDGKEVIIDDAFITDKKFIPINDPTGGQYNLFVPLEFGLYGSNFMGNYYIHELFSKKTMLHEILTEDTIHRIQSEMKKCNLYYRLDKIQDRIGNVVCKFMVEALRSTPKLLGVHGIEFDFSLDRTETPHRYCLHVFQEHDGIVYVNVINDDFDCSSVRVNSNQSKTTISILDVTTGLTLFCGQFDYSVYSNYYSQITPPTIIAQSSNKRILHFHDHDEIVELPNVQMVGSIYSFSEMEMSSKRKLRLEAEWLCNKGYLKAYNQNEHQIAIKDIVNIINNNLIWDLQELWIIDPYLSADDLISTALRCKKQGIIIKALGAYSFIHNNKETRESMEARDYEVFRQTQHDKLQTVLGTETDIKLDYRTVRNGHGVLFHDRYIMLKYVLNQDRVWSLGASINSIGKCHSIIQIVEAPEVLLSLFDKLWIQTDDEDCLLFSNTCDGIS